jgi:hypothetical protein
MRKDRLISQIHNEIRDELTPEHIVYYSGKYRIYKDGAMNELTDGEAQTLLSKGAILTACQIDERKSEVFDLKVPNEDGLMCEVRRVGPEPVPVPTKIINRAVSDAKRGGFGFMAVTSEPVITNLFFIEIM